MTVPLESSIVRIYSNNGQVKGAGFLVSQRLILTCAHVVALALGIKADSLQMPEGDVSLDFPRIAPGKKLTAKVVFWLPVNPCQSVEDIAALELVLPCPETAKPVELVTSDDLWDHPFRALGFPEGKSNGAWASGVLRASIANGWVQLEDVRQTGYRLEEGFSGTPVWDEKLQGVAGMAVAAEKNKNRPDTKAAFIIPSKVLRTAWADLGNIHLENGDGLPSPMAELEYPEGSVPLNSVFYLERPPHESDCYKEIVKPGSLINIKAPQKMGKKSLTERILSHAEQQDYATVSLNLTLAEGKALADLNQFLLWFCAIVGRRLKFSKKLEEYWDEIFGCKDNCTVYFEEYLLLGISNPLVLVLNEVDYLFSYPNIADGFFTLLRAWHEDAKNRNIWKKLRLVLVYSTEVYIKFDTNQSPFNVGLPIKLPEFTPEQVLDLARRHGLNWNNGEVEKLMEMVGGHPYLVRIALYHIARHEIKLDVLLDTAPTDAGLYSKHLRGQLWHLQQHPELKAAMKRVVESSNPVRLESREAFKLQSMGLINLQGNHVFPGCNLYRQYFLDRLKGNS